MLVPVVALGGFPIELPKRLAAAQTKTHTPLQAAINELADAKPRRMRS